MTLLSPEHVQMFQYSHSSSKLCGHQNKTAESNQIALECIFQNCYVSPIMFCSSTYVTESLKAGAGPTIENGATLQDGGVWVQGLDSRLMRIPSTEAELNSTDFKKQNCIPNMG